MVRQVSRNKGYTLIEMILVLSCVSVMTLLSIQHIPDASYLRFKALKALLRQSQLDSIRLQQRHDIQINKNKVTINDKEYVISPLICDPIIFHYNEQGNISKAFTMRCGEYEAVFQLGSGWISDE